MNFRWRVNGLLAKVYWQQFTSQTSLYLHIQGNRLISERIHVCNDIGMNPGYLDIFQDRHIFHQLGHIHLYRHKDFWYLRQFLKCHSIFISEIWSSPRSDWFVSIITLTSVRALSIYALGIIWTLSRFAFVDVNTFIFIVIHFKANWTPYKVEINAFSF